MSDLKGTQPTQLPATTKTSSNPPTFQATPYYPPGTAGTASYAHSYILVPPSGTTFPSTTPTPSAIGSDSDGTCVLYPAPSISGVPSTSSATVSVTILPPTGYNQFGTGLNIQLTLTYGPGDA
jgi:hypothetical protein